MQAPAFKSLPMQAMRLMWAAVVMELARLGAARLDNTATRKIRNRLGNAAIRLECASETTTREIGSAPERATLATTHARKVQAVSVRFAGQVINRSRVRSNRLRHVSGRGHFRLPRPRNGKEHTKLTAERIGLVAENRAITATRFLLLDMI